MYELSLLIKQINIIDNKFIIWASLMSCNEMKRVLKLEEINDVG